jgi:hypothetical protein
MALGCWWRGFGLGAVGIIDVEEAGRRLREGSVGMQVVVTQVGRSVGGRYDVRGHRRLIDKSIRRITTRVR